MFSWRGVALTTLLSLACACGVHRPFVWVGPGGDYRIEALGEENLLLAPPASDLDRARNSLSMRLILNERSRNMGARGCSISQALFRLTISPQKRSEMTLTLPSLDRWQQFLQTHGQEAEEDALDEFLNNVEELAHKGCLDNRVAIALRDLVRESLPVEPRQSLFSAYGYRVGQSEIDLKPRMQLRVERAFFKGRQQDLANYIGMRTVVYKVKEARDGTMEFTRSRVIYSSQTARRAARADLADAGLATRLGRVRLCRLFFFTTYVQKKIERAAMIVGAQSAERMAQVFLKFQSDPNLNCSAFRAGEITGCAEMDGSVTVSPEILVFVNEKARYVRWGADVRSLSSGASHLEVERLFQGRYFKIESHAGDAALRDLVLVGGDRVSFTKQH